MGNLSLTFRERERERRNVCIWHAELISEHAAWLLMLQIQVPRAFSPTIPPTIYPMTQIHSSNLLKTEATLSQASIGRTNPIYEDATTIWHILSVRQAYVVPWQTIYPLTDWREINVGSWAVEVSQSDWGESVKIQYVAWRSCLFNVNSQVSPWCFTVLRCYEAVGQRGEDNQLWTWILTDYWHLICSHFLHDGNIV